MADLIELQNLLREADARGDKENALRLIKKIEELKATEPPPTASEAPLPEPDIDTQYLPLGVTDIAEMHDPRGLAEGLQRSSSGFAQTGLAIGEEVGLVSEEEYKDYTFEEAKRRHQVEQEDWYKQSTMAKVDTFIGEMLPWFAFKVRGTTPAARTYEAGGMGGIAGATMFTTEEDDRLMNTLLGMNLGVAGQTLVDLKPRQLYMRRKVNQIMEDPFFQRAIERSEGLGDEGAVLTFAEITEHPWIASLQRSAMEGKQAARWKKHRVQALQKTDDALQQTLRAVHAGEVRLRDAGGMIRKAYKTHADNIYETAEREMGFALNKVDEMVGGKPIIETDGVIDEINLIIREWKKSGSKEQLAKINGLEVFRDSLQKSKFSPEGAAIGKEPRMLTAKEATKKFQKWGKASRGKGRVVFHDEGGKTLDSELAARIYRTFMNGMDRQSTVMGANMTRKGMEIFTTARTRYKQAMDYSGSVNNSQVGVIVEKAYQKTGSTPDEAFHKVLEKLDNSDLETTLHILNDVSPASVNAIRKRTIMDALDQASLAGRKGDIDWQYDPSHLARLLRKEGTGERGKIWTGVGVSMPKEGEIKNLLGKMRKLAQYEPSAANMAGLKEQGQRIAGLGGDVAAGGAPSPIFAAAAAYRPFWNNSRFVTEVLINPEARAAMMNLSYAVTKTGKTVRYVAEKGAGTRLAQSIMTLTGLMNETELSQFNDRLEQAQKNPYMFSAQKPTDVLRVSPEQMRSGEYAPRIR